VRKRFWNSFNMAATMSLQTQTSSSSSSSSSSSPVEQFDPRDNWRNPNNPANKDGSTHSRTTGSWTKYDRWHTPKNKNKPATITGVEEALNGLALNKEEKEREKKVDLTHEEDEPQSDSKHAPAPVREQAGDETDVYISDVESDDVQDVDWEARWESWNLATKLRFGAGWKAKVASWPDEEAAKFALRYDPAGLFHDAYYEVILEEVKSMVSNNGNARWVRRRRLGLKRNSKNRYETLLGQLDMLMISIRTCFTRYSILCDIVSQDHKKGKEQISIQKAKTTYRTEFARMKEIFNELKRKRTDEHAADVEKFHKRTKAAQERLAALQEQARTSSSLPTTSVTKIPTSWVFKK